MRRARIFPTILAMLVLSYSVLRLSGSGYLGLNKKAMQSQKEIFDRLLGLGFGIPIFNFKALITSTGMGIPESQKHKKVSTISMVYNALVDLQSAPCWW